MAANVQAGKTNTQTIGTTDVSEQTLVRPRARSIEQSAGETGVRAENVGSIHNSNTNPYVLAALMLFAGFVIPSPSEIARIIRSLFSKPNNKGAYHG